MAQHAERARHRERVQASCSRRRRRAMRSARRRQRRPARARTAPGGDVGDERMRNAVFAQLPGGQARPLQQRARLVDPDVQPGIARVRRAHHAERRAVATRGERTGIAVRQHARTGREQARSVAPHRHATRDLVGVNAPRQRRQRRAQLVGAHGLGDGTVAAGERPGKVDRRGSRCGQPGSRAANPRDRRNVCALELRAACAMPIAAAIPTPGRRGCKLPIARHSPARSCSGARRAHPAGTNRAGRPRPPRAG
jgi:hypothetical protein